ncbi:nucleotidyltransferase [Pedobacter roseus]|uniref:Nucleotidyltransferase n=1 Tax=Pedobacter roseus TaxID=336820 RepID=A0A7G9QDF8_9SPHI|nr:nucleotidyltransferase [Pedobacter roseus]QNN41383.1 nucleotidyltransferase [Pedobacter roseus]
MGNIFNDDFREFIQALNNQGVKYILVGGYSVILHGYSRTTGDMDIWVERTEENYRKIFNAFFQFGMPVFDMTKDNFLHHPDWEVFSFGRPPVSIDLMIIVKGLNFDECYPNSVFFEEDGLKIRTINYNDLLLAKKSAARAKDINDLENL